MFSQSCVGYSIHGGGGCMVKGECGERGWGIRGQVGHACIGEDCKQESKHWNAFLFTSADPRELLEPPSHDPLPRSRPDFFF